MSDTDRDVSSILPFHAEERDLHLSGSVLCFSSLRKFFCVNAVFIPMGGGRGRWSPPGLFTPPSQPPAALCSAWPGMGRAGPAHSAAPAPCPHPHRPRPICHARLGGGRAESDLVTPPSGGMTKSRSRGGMADFRSRGGFSPLTCEVSHPMRTTL